VFESFLFLTCGSSVGRVAANGGLAASALLHDLAQLELKGKFLKA